MAVRFPYPQWSGRSHSVPTVLCPPVSLTHCLCGVRGPAFTVVWPWASITCNGVDRGVTRRGVTGGVSHAQWCARGLPSPTVCMRCRVGLLHHSGEPSAVLTHRCVYPGAPVRGVVFLPYAQWCQGLVPATTKEWRSDSSNNSAGFVRPPSTTVVGFVCRLQPQRCGRRRQTLLL